MTKLKFFLDLSLAFIVGFIAMFIIAASTYPG
jgi:hypothetical protein